MKLSRSVRQSQYCHRKLRLLILIDAGLLLAEAERILAETETTEWREVA